MRLSQTWGLWLTGDAARCRFTRGIVKQSYALREKILKVDALVDPGDNVIETLSQAEDAIVERFGYRRKVLARRVEAHRDTTRVEPRAQIVDERAEAVATERRRGHSFRPPP